MKKIITFILVGFSLIAKGQISDALLSDTIDLWIYPNMVKSITATQVNDLFQYLNLNKLHKDSVLVSVSGDTLFVTDAAGSTDTLIVASGAAYWSASGADITNTNAGYVIIDSLMKIYPLPAEATKVGRIPVLQTSGLVEWASPLAVYISGLDSASKTPTPSPLLIWLKDTLTGYVRLADTTNPVGIGTTTPTEALDVVGKFKASDGYFNIGYRSDNIYTSDEYTYYGLKLGDTAAFIRTSLDTVTDYYSNEIYGGIGTERYARVYVTAYDTLAEVLLSVIKPSIESSISVNPDNINLTIDNSGNISSIIMYQDTIIMNTDSLVVNGSLTVTGDLLIGKTAGYDTITANTITAEAVTIDWGKSNIQNLALSDTVTVTFTAPPNYCHLTLKIVHANNTTVYPMTWPASVKWTGGTAITLTQTANAVDIVSFLYDGTNYYAMFGNDFK